MTTKLTDGLRKHWDAADIVYMPLPDALKLGFKERDAEILDALGLPDWAAPNMHFHIPSKLSDNEILLGEDRDERKLVYEKISGRVLAKCDDGEMRLVALDILSLLNVLIDYAELIDQAIMTVGSRAFTDNLIPDQLIDAFKAAVDGSLGGVDSIWAGEIARLRSHNPT